MVLDAWKHFLISSLKILYGITMIFSPLKPIFPLETKKVALYAPEQNVPFIRFWFQCFQTNIKLNVKVRRKRIHHRYQEKFFPFKCQFSLRDIRIFLNNEIFLMTIHFVESTDIFLETRACF